MDIQIDRDTIRHPLFWAVVIPILLLGVTVYLYYNLSDTRRLALRQQETADEILKHVEAIKHLRQRVSLTDSDSELPYTIREFNSISSARVCAEHAYIGTSKIERISVGTPKKQKDGSELISEKYNIKNVKLIEIAMFIDHAERQFDSVRCSQVAINHSRNKGRNTWDANIDLQYLRKPPVLQASR